METQNENFTNKEIIQFFKNFDKRLEKLAAENDKRAAENEKQRQEAKAENDRAIAELKKHMRGISLSNGMVAEETIFNALNKKKTFANIKFDFIRRNFQLQSSKYETLSELDLMMVNGDTVGIIEVKYKVEKDDIVELLNEKLNHFKQCLPELQNHKIVLGIGGMFFLKDAEEFAKKKGIGIIKVAGDIVEYDTENIITY